MNSKISKIVYLASILFSSSDPFEYPEIELKSMDLYLGYGENLTEEEFINRFITIEDNKTSLNNLIICFEPELKLNWPINSYSAIHVTDEDNNTTSKQFLYHVLDDVSPIIYGPSVLNFTNEDNIDISTILSYYQASDEVDGIVNITCKDNFDNHSTSLTLKACDNSNNQVSKTIKINISEKKEFWYVEATLSLDNTYYSAEDIVDLLIEKEYLENIDYLYACYKNNLYESNYMIDGLYPVEIDIFTLERSSPFTIKVNLSVINSNQEIVQEEPTPWWDSLFLFIKKLFQKIIDYFTF